jgi:hypothetical protein
MLANPVIWEEFFVSDELRLRAEELAKTKYSQQAYNERR